jgi:hypothetical protein
MVGNDVVNSVDYLGLKEAKDILLGVLDEGLKKSRGMITTKNGHGNLPHAIEVLKIGIEPTKVRIDEKALNEVGGDAQYVPTYGLGGGTILIKKNPSLLEVIHESTHAHFIDKQGNRSDEGRAYAMESIYTIHDEFNKLWDLLHRKNDELGDNCPAFRRLAEGEWRGFSEILQHDDYTVDYGRFPFGLGGRSARSQGPLRFIDLARIKGSALGASFSCEKAASIINQSKLASGCCFKVSCEKGPPTPRADYDGFKPLTFKVFATPDLGFD